jgi:hypothetical protein
MTWSLRRLAGPGSTRCCARIAFGSNVVDAGGGIDVLASLLGHASVSSSQAYIHPDPARLVARDHAASHAIMTPHGLGLARRQDIGDLLGDILPRGRDRRYERVRKQPKNSSQQCNVTGKGHPARSPTR